MRYYASLLSTALLILASCGQGPALDYAFAIKNVSIRPAYQSLDIHLQQDLELSAQARAALEHGVTLTVTLEMELRSDNDMIVTRRDARRFQLRYLPLSERYQLSEEKTGELKAFTRLRHMLAAMDDFSVQLATGHCRPAAMNYVPASAWMKVFYQPQCSYPPGSHLTGGMIRSGRYGLSK